MANFIKRMSPKYLGLEKAKLHFDAGNEVHCGDADNCSLCQKSKSSELSDPQAGKDKSPSKASHRLSLASEVDIDPLLDKINPSFPVAYLSYGEGNLHLTVAFGSGTIDEVKAKLRILFALVKVLPHKIKAKVTGVAPFIAVKRPDAKCYLVKLNPNLKKFDSVISRLNGRKWMPHITSETQLPPVVELTLSKPELFIYNAVSGKSDSNWKDFVPSIIKGHKWLDVSLGDDADPSSEANDTLENDKSADINEIKEESEDVTEKV